MTTEKVKDAAGHTLTVTNFRGHRLPTFPLESLQRLDTFVFRDDDVIIGAYPKSGTHWVWEITRMLREGRTDLPVVEKDDYNIELDITDIASMPSPRILCTHLLYHQLPTLRSARSKLVYITRNPRDVAVSFYNHHVKLAEYYHYNGEWKDYFHLFVDGELDYGSWFDYTRDWERVMDTEPLPPVICLSYEDLKENPVAEVGRLSQFLGKSHDEAFIQSVCEACDFSNMKKRKGALELSTDGTPIMYRKGLAPWNAGEPGAKCCPPFAAELVDSPSFAAELAKDSAEMAQDSAELAKDSAEMAQDSAELAQDSAELAQDSAELAAELAQDSAELAQDSAELVDSPSFAAELAKDSAELAQDSAELAQDSAELAVSPVLIFGAESVADKSPASCVELVDCPSFGAAAAELPADGGQG